MLKESLTTWRANHNTTKNRVSGLGSKCSLAWAAALVLTAGPGATAQPVRLLVSSDKTDNILRYNGATGTFSDAFVPVAGGGLSVPVDRSSGECELVDVRWV